ncbi:unnamed protein product [Cuscuta europaea]|uniref:Chorein N-terminal domain-containing protein n=1 Tax=Cuscuta europaea TaxID=41803 RepID=A0A9P0ZMB9_CUSEU|nr:unnamed protein product [Cuscuta europaea]
MESLIARALEYTLKYWLKSFSRDQFKLQGRTALLYNLDINGDALHASVGLPPALNVTSAKVGKLEIILPSVSNVQIEPIIIQIDRLDIVLEENDNVNIPNSFSSATSFASSTKSSGYGLADKIADGMTLEVHTVNLLLETHGGSRRRGGATWASPMASITIRNLLLYTTNEKWQVVNLKEARDFSNNKNFIYVFKKLKWEYLSIDLLPHPDMFSDAYFASSQVGSHRKDEDGARRVFFGGERFVEGISGEANITIQRTELNNPMGLEVQLHITEAVCPALSEPGLRALLRFMTGLYVCLNRGDVNPNVQQHSSEAAGRSLVSIVVDHIFLCIKDTDFQLELLMQSLFFSRASLSNGENAKYLSIVMIGGLFLRDTFSHPPCTLVQPLMLTSSNNVVDIPDFAKDFFPPIYPLGEQQWQLGCSIPLISIHSLQLKPTPCPPIFASETVIHCHPLKIHLQEESCLRIASLLADGIVVNPGAVLPEFSIGSLMFSLKGLDITVPLGIGKHTYNEIDTVTSQGLFSGTRLHIEDLFFSESPLLKLKLLNLEKDPACFCLWKGQPVDASQKKLMAGASIISLSLETCNLTTAQSTSTLSSGSWSCVELKDFCTELAMATADGSPLTNVPPPGGVVRVGVACQQYMSNTSADQLFFVLDLYAYFGRVSERIATIAQNNPLKDIRNDSLGEILKEKVPGDTGVCLTVKNLQLSFLESSLNNNGMPLVHFMGNELFIKVTHRTLGGAVAISSSLVWESIRVDCADTAPNWENENELALTAYPNGSVDLDGYQLRAVFWVQNSMTYQSIGSVKSVPLLDLNMVQVIPFNTQDLECHTINISACIAGVRLGGGMNYAEALLHKFGIFGPDGGPGEGLNKGLEHLSAGPLSKLFKSTPLIANELKERGSIDNGKDVGILQFGTPDDLDVSIELKDWLFALEGAQESAERWWFQNHEDSSREERCWHASFHSIGVKAKGCPKQKGMGNARLRGKLRHPVELVTVGVEDLQISKPQTQKVTKQSGLLDRVPKETSETYAGINLEVDLVSSEEKIDDGMAKWVVENVKFSVKQPIEAIVRKDELQYLTFLCQSEIDSMGRITAGILRVLKLEGSVGQAAISQLSNLGSEGFERIFTPCSNTVGLSPPSSGTCGIRNCHLDATVASLEELLLETQASCEALGVELHSSESSSEQLENFKQMSKKLESMQKLLLQLRTQI